MLDVLELSKRTYYKYRNAEDKDYYDYLLIKEVFDKSKRTYGYRRISECLLVKYGVIINHKKVLRIMNKYSIKPEYIKRINPNNSFKRIEENVRPNLIKRNFNVDKENKVWCTDITYLIFKNERMYLSTIIDLYDRKVVAYQISKSNSLIRPSFTTYREFFSTSLRGLYFSNVYIEDIELYFQEVATSCGVAGKIICTSTVTIEHLPLPEEKDFEMINLEK